MSSSAFETQLEERQASTRRQAVVGAAVPAAVAAVYFGAAKLGLALSVAHGVITPVWAPTGIALAATLLYGRRVWPAILVAAFLANATSGASPAMALAIAAGNTLEAVAGRELLVRVGFRPNLGRIRDVLALVGLGAAASTALAATNGVTALWIGGDLGSSYGSSWLLWWVGDAMGDLLVASLLLVLLTVPLRDVLARGRRLEAAALLALFAGLGCFVFLAGYWRYPHLLFPLYIWATLRFGQPGAVVGSFTVAAIAVAGAVSGHTPIGNASGTHVVLILEGLLAGITISVLVLGAVLAERAEAQELLAEAEELAHLGSWSWDVESDRIAWSEELQRLFGLEPTSAPIGYDTYVQRLHPDDRGPVAGVIEQAFADRQPFAFEHRVVEPDGRVRWLLGRGRVVTDAQGRVTRLFGTAQDVTERRQVDELRDGILAAVSHELRTPLTVILGFAVTLRERVLPEEVRAHALDEVSAHARRLERLLVDLLDLDRLRHGFVRANLLETDLAALAERVVADYENGEQTVALRTEGPTVARVDAAKVERILDNLLTNAVRHTPPGTEIGVQIRGGPAGFELRVDDAGPGVPPEEREAIFESFRRGSDAAVRPGTGVGLALVAQFTALHDGRAWVEESPSGGASFRVFLPAS